MRVTPSARCSLLLDEVSELARGVGGVGIGSHPALLRRWGICRGTRRRRRARCPRVLLGGDVLADELAVLVGQGDPVREPLGERLRGRPFARRRRGCSRTGVGRRAVRRVPRIGSRRGRTRPVRSPHRSVVRSSVRPTRAASGPHEQRQAHTSSVRPTRAASGPHEQRQAHTSSVRPTRTASGRHGVSVRFGEL
jgi:hypothetical protein